MACLTMLLLTVGQTQAGLISGHSRGKVIGGVGSNALLDYVFSDYGYEMIGNSVSLADGVSRSSRSASSSVSVADGITFDSGFLKLTANAAGTSSGPYTPPSAAAAEGSYRDILYLSPGNSS